MPYGLLLTLHLLAAMAFAGTVFFEVMMLGGVRRHLPAGTLRMLESELGRRATAVMPWVLLALYAAGASMAWRYRAALAHPLDSSLGTMLALKIVLALSVLGHFATAMHWRHRGLLSGRRSRCLHLSVFVHVLAIVVLAKAMFHLAW